MGQLHQLFTDPNHNSVDFVESTLNVSSRTIKVCIVDDHNFIKDAMVALVKTFTRVKEVYSVSNGKLLVDSIPVFGPDLILLDIRMPVMDGLEASKILLEKYPGIKILILTMGEDEKAMHTLLKLGVHGYLTKGSDVDVVEKAIYQVMDTGYFFSDDVSKSLVSMFRREKALLSTAHEQSTALPDLTEREVEIVKLLCAELNNEKIANQLNISIKTLQVHKQNIYKKIGGNSLISIFRYACKAGLIESRLND